MKFSELKGLGYKSETFLREIGINTAQELAALGAIKTFIRLKKQCST
jgi:DNA transformation protein